MKGMSCYHSPAGLLVIESDETGITRIERVKPDFYGAGRPSPLTEAAVREFAEYFKGQRKSFDLPLSLSGTPFQLRVWEELQKIPYGETISYGELAARCGNKKACRAVGMANHNNPVMIIVPCHRVIGKNGSLTGYAGGLDVKRLLLELERKNNGLNL